MAEHLRQLSLTLTRAADAIDNERENLRKIESLEDEIKTLRNSTEGKTRNFILSLQQQLSTLQEKSRSYNTTMNSLQEQFSELQEEHKKCSCLRDSLDKAKKERGEQKHRADMLQEKIYKLEAQLRLFEVKKVT